jgi:hypothetical protein
MTVDVEVVTVVVDAVVTADVTPVGAAVDNVDTAAPPMTITTPCMAAPCTSQKYAYVPCIVNLAVNEPDTAALPERK